MLLLCVTCNFGIGAYIVASWSLPAEQIDLIARMKADGDSERAIAAGEAVLATLRRALQLAREYLEWEQQRRDRDARGPA